MCVVYQGCPFCERVFELGCDDYEPMKRHIRFAHGKASTNGSRPERAVA